MIGKHILGGPLEYPNLQVATTWAPKVCKILAQNPKIDQKAIVLPTFGVQVPFFSKDPENEAGMRSCTARAGRLHEKVSP